MTNIMNEENARRATAGRFFSIYATADHSDLPKIHIPVVFSGPTTTIVMAHDDCTLSMTSAPSLDIQELTCCYGDRTVLNHLSLTLNEGEILGVTGAVGAGISTLMKAILLLVAPRAGQVLIFSRSHELADSRAYLAYLPEDLKTPGHLTGYDVINMARKVHGQMEAKASIDELAIDLDLSRKLLAHPTRNYSEADIKKLGLIALLSMERPILLLDQPMSAVDEATRTGLVARLRDHVDQGGSVLMGSHAQGDHQGLADRVLTLEGGELQSAKDAAPVQTLKRAG